MLALSAPRGVKRSGTTLPHRAVEPKRSKAVIAERAATLVPGVSVRGFMTELFDDLPLARVLLQQWSFMTLAMHSSLRDRYRVFFRILFDTPLNFSVALTNDRTTDCMLTHDIAGFEVKLALLTAAQTQQLARLIETVTHREAFCAFERKLTHTAFVDGDTARPWCNIPSLFALFLDEELVSARDFPERAMRAEAMSYVLQDMLASQCHLPSARVNCLQRAIELIFDTVAAGAQLPLTSGELHAKLM
jgi:hypothetical protein